MLQDDDVLCKILHLQRLVFVKIHVCKIHGDKKGQMLGPHYVINRKEIV